MDLNNLKVFYEVCRHQNFTKASEKLFISQSAVSIQIKKLEKNLNVKLIERTSKNFKLTLAGKKLFKIASDIFGRVNRLENDIKRIVENTQIKINIGATHNIGEPILPIIIKEYSDYRKDVQFDIYVKNGNSLLQYLKDGLIDVILVEDMQVEDDDIKVIYTDDYPYIIAAPNFVKKYEDLKNLYYLKRESNQISSYLEQFEESIGFTHSKEMLINGSIETIKNLITMGVGYAVIPYYCAYEGIQNNEFKIIHSFDKSYSKFQIMFLKESFDNDLLKDFVNFIRVTDINKPLQQLKNKL